MLFRLIVLQYLCCASRHFVIPSLVVIYSGSIPLCKHSADSFSICFCVIIISLSVYFYVANEIHYDISTLFLNKDSFPVVRFLLLLDIQQHYRDVSFEDVSFILGSLFSYQYAFQSLLCNYCTCIIWKDKLTCTMIIPYTGNGRSFRVFVSAIKLLLSNLFDIWKIVHKVRMLTRMYFISMICCSILCTAPGHKNQWLP